MNQDADNAIRLVGSGNQIPNTTFSDIESQLENLGFVSDDLVSYINSFISSNKSDSETSSDDSFFRRSNIDGSDVSSLQTAHNAALQISVLAISAILDVIRLWFVYPSKIN